MVNVFFESKGHAELVAIFQTEELYMACLPILEYQAKENRMIVTESITENDISDFDFSGEPTGEKPFVTHNDKEIPCGGTSLQGEVIASFSELVHCFGEPTVGDAYKTDAEWELEFKDGTVATIYNWKDGVNYNGSNGQRVENIRSWHIGGREKNVVGRVIDIIEANE